MMCLAKIGGSVRSSSTTLVSSSFLVNSLQLKFRLFEKSNSRETHFIINQINVDSQVKFI